MKSDTISFRFEEAKPLAIQYFLDNSGISFSSEKHDRMWARAENVLEDIKHELNLKAVYAAVFPDEWEGNTMLLNGQRFCCPVFERVSPADVYGVYAYMLTVGNQSDLHDNIVDQLYADIWGTAFVDAGRDLLHQHLLAIERTNRSEATLSQSFGPGFYGMDVEQTRQLFHLLPAEEMGITLHQSGIMLPQKSCTGLYFSVSAKTSLPPHDCENCLGNKGGCRFCNVG